MRFTRLQSPALVQIHPDDRLRIEPPTGNTMLAQAFSWRPVAMEFMQFAIAPQGDINAFVI
jgi:hypothetical protein